MNPEIYYFSGTGNSLSVARTIAEKTAGELISIPGIVERQSIRAGSDRIGIVFPCYLAPLSGIPLIVERFIQKLANIESKYLFAVCTCGGYEIVNALPTLRNLAGLIVAAGGTLSAGFSVRLPMNNPDYEHIPVPINTDPETMQRNCDRKLDGIVDRIRSGKPTKYRLPKALFTALMGPMYGMLRKSCLLALGRLAQEPESSDAGFRDLIPLTDKSIRVDDACAGCGTCARVCPVRNIELIDGRPVFRHRCEMCFACDEWCPGKAVHHWGRAAGVKYHHPRVGLKDMLAGAGSRQ